VFGGSTATGGTSVAATTTIAAPADCASHNYAGRACEDYNDPSNPSVCLTRLPITKTICRVSGNRMCTTNATKFDVACYNACVVCVNDYTEGKTKCFDAMNVVVGLQDGTTPHCSFVD
jgi:hypothetical protein